MCHWSARPPPRPESSSRIDAVPRRADRRVRNQFAEPHGKTLLPRVVEMVLVAEEDDLVLEQNLVDRRDRPVREIARELDVPDLRADTCRPLDDIRARNDVVDGDCVRHVIFPKIAIPFGQGSAVRRSLMRWRSKYTADGRDRSSCSIAVCSGGNRVRRDLPRETASMQPLAQSQDANSRLSEIASKVGRMWKIVARTRTTYPIDICAFCYSAAATLCVRHTAGA